VHSIACCIAACAELVLYLSAQPSSAVQWPHVPVICSRIFQALIDPKLAVALINCRLIVKLPFPFCLRSLDLKYIARCLGKLLHCSCRVKSDRVHGWTIILMGDHKYAVRDWLYKEEIYMAKENRIIVHGV